MAINYGSLQATLTPRGVVSGKVQNATRAFVKDYDLLDNKPKVNGVELLGDKSLDDLGIEIPEIVANPGDTTENLTSIGIDGVNYNIQGSGGSAVTSVNGKTGDVMLDAEDVGALPDDTPIPSELADLSEDSTHRTVTDTEKTAWNAKSDFSGSYNDLTDKPTIPDAQIQSDWNQSDNTKKDFIKNKPTIPASQVNSDWNASSGVAEILNKPTLGTAAAKDSTNAVTQGSTDLVESGAVWSAIDNLPEPMVFKGTLGVNGTITSLPTVSSSNNGYTYKVITDGTYDGKSAKVGDVFTSNGSEWVLIPSGDETFTDTWRSVKVNDTELLGSSITTGAVNFKSGSNVSISGSGNDITFSAQDTTYSKATAQADGLMSKEDFSKLSGVESGAQVNTVTGVKGNAESEYRTGNVNITPTNIGLGNVDNTSDSTKKTNFTGSIASENTGFVTGSDVYSALADKVDKVNGKGLSTEDYTTAEKTKLGAISDEANKVTSSSTNGHINIDGVDTTVYDDSSVQSDIEDIQDELSTESATIEGNPINFSTKSAQNAESTTIDFEPIQDLHGYDKPWVGGAGKNLLPINQKPTVSQSNITYTIVTDSDENKIGVKANGTISGGATLSYSVIYGDGASSNNLNGHTTAVFSSGTTLKIGSLASPISLNFRYTDGTYENNVQGRIMTLAKDVGLVYLQITGAGTQVNDVVCYPYIYASTETLDTFTPYSNECPISGRTEIGILGCGKNLVSGTITSANIVSSGEIGTQDGYNVCYGKISKNSKYTITTDDAAGAVYGFYTNVPAKGSTSYDGTRSVSNNKTFTAPIDGYIAFRTSSTYAQAQLEKGETATAYEPYTKSNDLTISLGQTVYGGQLDVEKGELNVTYKIVDLSTFTDTQWVRVTNTQNPIFAIGGNIVAPDGKQYEAQQLPNAKCEGFKFINSMGQTDFGKYALDGECTFRHSNNNLYVRYDEVTTVEDFITAISGMKIVYELAEPITIQLTPHQISLLESVNNISTTGDKITMTYRDGKVATLGDVSIAKALDTNISNPTNNQVLKFDSSEGKWKNANESGGGSGHIYSTTEQVVGTWIDGKTLYEKTFTYPGPYSGNAAHDLALLSNINFIGFEMFVAQNQDDLYCPIPYVNAQAQYMIAVWIASDSSKIILSTYGGHTISNVVAVVRYTKNTD